MKYYQLLYSTNLKEVGKFPQCKGLPKGKTVKWFEAENSITKLDNGFFPEKEPDLIFELEEKSKLTDAISPSNISCKGLLINGKIGSVLDKFNLMKHRYYPATVWFKEKSFDYYWLHIVQTQQDLNYIDYKNSSFCIANLAFMKEKDIEIISANDYMDKLRPMKHIIATKLVLLPEFLRLEVDLFFFPYVMRYYLLISERLKNKLEQEKISGLDIREQSIIL